MADHDSNRELHRARKAREEIELRQALDAVKQERQTRDAVHFYDTATGRACYYTDLDSGDMLYRHGDGCATFYRVDDTVFDIAAFTAAFWIEGGYLHPYDGTAQPTLYFDPEKWPLLEKVDVAETNRTYQRLLAIKKAGVHSFSQLLKKGWVK